MRGARFVAIADQGVSSVSNFAVVAFAAVTGTPSEFGQFALAYAVFVFFLGAGRALVGETLLVRESHAEARPSVSLTTGATLVVGLPGAAVLLVMGMVIGGASGDLWAVLALATLAATVQDGLRFVALAAGRPTHALVLDLVWTIPSLVAMIVLAAFGAGATAVVGAWTAAALLSALVGFAAARSLPSFLGGLRWLLAHRSAATRYVLEFASLNASTLLVWIVLAPVVGIAGVGALRGAQLLLSPLNTVYTSLRIAMIPELIRVQGTSRHRRRTWEFAGILLAALVVWGGVVLLLTGDLGRLVLGATWEQTAPLRPAFVAQYALLAVYTFVLTRFRATRADAASTRMRAAMAVATLVLPIALAFVWGTHGAAWGFAAAVAVAAVVGAASLRPRR